MKILITGGAGFIGSHLVRAHLEKKNEVWAVDNFLSGKKENIQPFSSNSHFRFSQADVNNWEQLEEAVKWADQIYHMAAILGQKFVFSHPVDVLSVNIRLCERILQVASSFKKQVKILVTSSSSVYGHERDILHKKEDAVLPILSGKHLQETYPLSKIVNEVMALTYVHSQHIDCVIVRLFNTIGPHQTGVYGMVVPTFVQQALQNKPITVYGDGTQTRSFCDVRDAVHAIDKLMNIPASKGQIVNVGNTEEISILALAEKVKAKTKSSSKIVLIPYKEAYGIDYTDIMRRIPNIDKLKQLTGFTPQVSLDETLDTIIADSRARLGS